MAGVLQGSAMGLIEQQRQLHTLDSAEQLDKVRLLLRSGLGSWVGQLGWAAGLGVWVGRLGKGSWATRTRSRDARMTRELSAAGRGVSTAVAGCALDAPHASSAHARTL
jgi:hypothetical protein